MNDTNLQQQINAIDQKLDLILQYVNEQRLKGNMVEDLVADVSIIGKDAYQSTVTELENQNIEIDPDELRIFFLKLLKNANNFSLLLSTFESLMDLAKDAAPLTHEATIDLIYKLHEIDQKGYFEFFSTLGKLFDNIITHYNREDVELMADNAVIILDTVKNLTQPDMLRTINNAVAIFKDIDPANVQEYSLWKTFRALNTPEMKKGMGFIITFLKGLSSGSQNIN